MSGLSSIVSAAFGLAYSTSPILLSGGIASGVPGGLLPIAALLDPISLVSGILGGAANPLQTLPQFVVMPGGTLIDVEAGTYPFANQTVAANAIIVEPLRLSLQMIAPAQAPAGYTLKIATFSALQVALSSHINQGGLFMVATPAFFYQNGILLKVHDVSSDDTLQVQTRWQFDLYFPLVTLAQAQAAQNNLLSKITNGLPLSGDPIPLSGVGAAAGAVPVGAGLVPSVPGAGIGGGQLGGATGP